MGRVEREESRLERRRLALAHGTRALGRERALARARERHEVALPELERRVHRLAQPADGVGRDLEAVDDHLDRVALVALERTHLLDARHGAVDAHAHEALLAQVLEDGAVLALAVAHERRENLHVLAAVGLGEGAHDRLRCLGGERRPVLRAMGRPGAREEHPQVVHHFGHGAHGRAWAPLDGLLVHRDGRREAVDAIDVGLLHAPEELARIGR
jgi:hypothetical protein